MPIHDTRLSSRIYEHVFVVSAGFFRVNYPTAMCVNTAVAGRPLAAGLAAVVVGGVIAFALLGVRTTSRSAEFRSGCASPSPSGGPATSESPRSTGEPLVSAAPDATPAAASEGGSSPSASNVASAACPTPGPTPTHTATTLPTVTPTPLVSPTAVPTVTTLTYSGGIVGAMANPVTTCAAHPTPGMAQFVVSIKIVGEVGGISRTIDFGRYSGSSSGGEWDIYEGLTADMTQQADTFSAKYFHAGAVSIIKPGVGGTVLIPFIDLGGRGVPPMTVSGVVVCP